MGDGAMDIERFKRIAAATGFQQTEDEETLCHHDHLPLEQFLGLIEQIKQHGFNLTEVELRFADADDEVIVLTHDPDDDTAFLELLAAEEEIEY